jgi:hypothetical protein
MNDDPRNHAISVEVVKIAMNQDKNGYFLRLALHPSDEIQALVNAPVGSRFMAAFVQVSDQGAPTSNSSPAVGGPSSVSNGRDAAVTQSSLLCREPRFQQWLFVNSMVDQPTEAAAIAGLYKTLGITSRSQLVTNLEARERWFRMRKAFMATIDL